MSNKTSTPDDAYIGQRIRQARMEKQLSQADLGEALDITYQQIQKIERGDNRISGGRLRTISRILGKPIGWFFPDDDNLGTIDPTTSSFMTSADGVKIAAMFPRIKSPKLRQTIVHLIERMVSDQ